jgi:hypothetical protein
MRLLTEMALIGALALLAFGGVYDTKLAQQENSSGATDSIIVRTNKLTGEVCERYEMATVWTCK